MIVPAQRIASKATGCPFARPELNGTAELHINNSATLQEVHRQSSAQETGPAEVHCSGQITCQFQEDLVSLSREKKKDQLSQLVSVLNAGVMKLLRFKASNRRNIAAGILPQEHCHEIVNL